MLFKDSANRKSNQQNLGTIKSSNLCTEIIEFTSPEETAVCNLASIALPRFVRERAAGGRELPSGVGSAGCEPRQAADAAIAGAFDAAGGGGRTLTQGYFPGIRIPSLRSAGSKPGPCRQTPGTGRDQTG